MNDHTDVAIIGAGPAGSVAGALLKKLGHSVVILEQNQFPRFSIGESLLPQCMTFIEEAGMLASVSGENFQLKNGAVFRRDGRYGSFDFRHKLTSGPSTTMQVQRARFDQVLAQSAVDQGVDIRFGQRITAVDLTADQPLLSYSDKAGLERNLQARFILDASGFGRVLPRLLGLERPSDFPPRRSLFTHIEDNITQPGYDREKILIVIHPEYKDVWYWLIPFSDGRCSLGLVAEDSFFNGIHAQNCQELLKSAVSASPDLSGLLSKANYDRDVQDISGYSSNVTSLYGNNFALLGNAGEFLDPVFSSGVTIAMKSASLVAPLVSRYLNNEAVDWGSEYAAELKVGVDTFRAYVNAWYDGSLQDIIFANNGSLKVRQMVCSILAGYAWDTNNPLVKEPKRRLSALAEICATA